MSEEDYEKWAHEVIKFLELNGIKGEDLKKVVLKLFKLVYMTKSPEFL